MASPGRFELPKLAPEASALSNWATGTFALLYLSLNPIGYLLTVSIQSGSNWATGTFVLSRWGICLDLAPYAQQAPPYQASDHRAAYYIAGIMDAYINS